MIINETDRMADVVDYEQLDWKCLLYSPMILRTWHLLVVFQDYLKNALKEFKEA